MKICWLETRRGDSSGVRIAKPMTEVSAGLRYAKFIIDELEGELITDAATLRSKQSKDYDVIISGYSTGYNEYKLEAEFIKASSARLFHISTEYGNALPASLYYAKRRFEQIANYEKIPQHQISGGWVNRKKFYHLDLNLFFFRPSASQIKKKYGAVYYGRFREDRACYLRLLEGTNIPISTAKENIKEWIKNGVSNVSFITPFSWQSGMQTLSLFRYSVYFEDRYTHKNYNCPANRWYEALSLDVQPIIHSSCVDTLTRAGVDLQNAIIFSNRAELSQMVANANLFDEMSEWRNHERERCAAAKSEMIGRLKSILDGDHIAGSKQPCQDQPNHQDPSLVADKNEAEELRPSPFG